MSAIKRFDIPVSYLRECVAYDTTHGLVWLERPREHFPDDRIYHTWNSKFANKFLVVNGKNYQQTKLAYNGKQYKLYHHQMIWALCSGNWPENEIDHKNGNRSDNKIENLRLATHSQNHQNRSALTRVSWDKRRKKWYARIGLNRESYFLGYFDTPEAAQGAYLEAKSRLHTYQPQPRSAIGG